MVSEARAGDDRYDTARANQRTVAHCPLERVRLDISGCKVTTMIDTAYHRLKTYPGIRRVRRFSNQSQRSRFGPPRTSQPRFRMRPPGAFA